MYLWSKKGLTPVEDEINQISIANIGLEIFLSKVKTLLS